MTAILGLLIFSSILGLRKKNFDLYSFGILATVILVLVITQHLDAVYGVQKVE